MSLPLLNYYARGKRHWAEYSPHEFLEVLREVDWAVYPAIDWMERLSKSMSAETKDSGNKRKVIGRRENTSRGALTKKQKEDAILTIWDLRSTAFEWGAAKIREISGHRHFDHDMHLDLVKTLKTYIKSLPKGPELGVMKRWGKDYQLLYNANQNTDAIGVMWIYIQDFRETDLPPKWLEELHKFYLRWPYELDMKDALETMGIIIMASMEEVRSIARDPLVQNFDDRRFSIMCMFLDHFDITYRYKMKRKESLEELGAQLRFAEIDLAKFLDFEISVRQIDFGGAMPAIGRWFRYCRGVIDLDKYCLGYAWEFFAFCAFMVDEATFIWIWDVNENFDQHRLENKIAVTKSFTLKLQEFFKERFPNGEHEYMALNATKDTPNTSERSQIQINQELDDDIDKEVDQKQLIKYLTSKSLEEVVDLVDRHDKRKEEQKLIKQLTSKNLESLVNHNESNLLQNELNILKRKPFFVSENLLEGSSFKVKTVEPPMASKQTKPFEEIFKEWVDDMAGLISLYGNESLGISSEPVTGYQLGPYEIKGQGPLHLVLTRFAVCLYGKGVNFPPNLKEQLKEKTAIYREKAIVASEAMGEKRQNITSISFIPNPVRVSGVHREFFETLSVIIGRATRSSPLLKEVSAPPKEVPIPPKEVPIPPKEDSIPAKEVPIPPKEDYISPKEVSVPPGNVSIPLEEASVPPEAASFPPQEDSLPSTAGGNKPRSYSMSNQSDKTTRPDQPDQLDRSEISIKGDQPSESDHLITDHAVHVTGDHTYPQNESASSALIFNAPSNQPSSAPSVSTEGGMNPEAPPKNSNGPSGAIPRLIGESIQNIVDYTRDTAGDFNALYEEIYSLRALVTVLIDGDSRSRRSLMNTGHLAVPFAQMRTNPSLDRSSIFSQRGRQYAETFLVPPLSRSVLAIDDEEFYS